jgi:hypothetical protein
MKTFYSNVTIKFGMNPFEARNKKDYIQMVKDSFHEEYGIDLQDYEITDIQEV